MCLEDSLSDTAYPKKKKKKTQAFIKTPAAYPQNKKKKKKKTANPKTQIIFPD